MSVAGVLDEEIHCLNQNQETNKKNGKAVLKAIEEVMENYLML